MSTLLTSTSDADASLLRARTGNSAQDGPANNRREQAHNDSDIQAPECALRPRRHEVHRGRQHLSVCPSSILVFRQSDADPYLPSPKAEVFIPLSAPRYDSLSTF